MDPIKVASKKIPYSDSVLLYCHINDPKKIYGNIASSKANLSFTYKMDTLDIQQKFPHLIAPGETKYAGGIYLDGWVVAVSGFAAEFDELLAKTIANTLTAIYKYQMNKVLLPDKERRFL